MTIKQFCELYPPKRILRFILMSVANWPMLPRWRAKIYKCAGVNIGEGTLIYRNVSFDTVAPEKITIGRGCRITSGTKILTHFIDPSVSGVHFRIGEVVIEDDVFIGVNTIICNSVRIENGAIIGAGSIVTKDIPAFQIWAGNPAHYIKDRNH